MDLSTPVPPSQIWLQTVVQRLAIDGFVTLMPAAVGYPFSVATRKSRIELTKFGYVETFFVFVELPSITPEILKQFSTDAFCYSLSNVTCPLPCGLGEVVICYAVAIVPFLDEQTIATIRSTTFPRHVGAFQIPIVYDMSRQHVLFYERVPSWGYAYYPGFFKQIRKYLAGA